VSEPKTPRDFGHGMMEDLSRSPKVVRSNKTGEIIIKLLPVIKEGNLETKDWVMDPFDEEGQKRFKQLGKESKSTPFAHIEEMQ